MTDPYTNTISSPESEKREIIVNAAKLGVILILYDIVCLQLNFIRNAFLYLYYWCVTFNFTFDKTLINAFYANSDNFSSTTAFEMIYSCGVVLMSLLIVIILARIMGIRLVSTLKLQDKRGIKSGLKMFPVVLLLNSVISTVITFVSDFFEGRGVVLPEADFSISNPNALAVIFEILYLVVVAPLAEELIFRGLVLRTIAPYGKKLAIIVSASLFGLMHGNIKQFAGAFACGMIFAAVDIKYGSVLPSVIMHVLNNMLPVIYNIGDAVDSKAIKIIYFVLFYSIMLVGIYILVTKYKSFSIGEEPQSELPYSERIKAVVFNVPAVYALYLVFVLIYTIITANK